MSVLTDGKYYMVPATPSGPPALPIGGLTNKSPSPIVVGGGDRLWTVKGLGNRMYTLALEQFGPRFTKISRRDIVVDLVPTSQTWWIYEQDDGTYTIRVPTSLWPYRAWSVCNTKPDSEVKIGVYEHAENLPRWKFLPVEETD